MENGKWWKITKNGQYTYTLTITFLHGCTWVRGLHVFLYVRSYVLMYPLSYRNELQLAVGWHGTQEPGVSLYPFTRDLRSYQGCKQTVDRVVKFPPPPLVRRCQHGGRLLFFSMASTAWTWIGSCRSWTKGKIHAHILSYLHIITYPFLYTLVFFDLIYLWCNYSFASKSQPNSWEIRQWIMEWACRVFL